ncbi:hypothetical protein BC828DRAFT_54031 [Blastocladiella britannica]|nr:hypothetical protein BC828DRAFT_54031 [Blastocladiella britannica]
MPRPGKSWRGTRNSKSLAPFSGTCRELSLPCRLPGPFLRALRFTTYPQHGMRLDTLTRNTKKTFVDFEVAAHKSHTAISDLHGRVIFVLDTMRRLDKKREWSKDEDLAHAVLRPLKDPIRACSVLFSDYKGQSWFSRRLYGKSTLNKIGELDASLTSAMADATFALGLTMAGNAMPAIAMDMDPAAQAAADAVARSGGMTVFLKDPAGVTALGKQLAAQLGERFDPGTMLVEVQRGFDERFSALDKSFEDVLTAVATQGKSIDEAKVMLDELCKRNSMYTQIRCAGLRDLWLTAGWGARIKMTVFIDVIIEQLRADVSDAIAISGLSPRKGVIPGHLSALYDGFEKVLLSIDEDQSGTMSPQEVNDFFAFDSWRLMDYFTLVSFFMTTTRAELLKSLQHEFGLIARRLMTPTEDNQYALFFGNLRPTIVAMRDLASEQAETEGALPDWLEHTPALYDRSAMYKRLGKWDWSHMAQYAPPSFANLHAMFAQTVDLAAALEGGIDAFQWTKFETAVRGLESHISEWTPELAKHLIKTVDAALVWHGDGSRFMGDPTARANFEFTATRPFPRVAVMKHTTRRPPNAIVGGTMGGETLYLTTTIYRAKRGKSYRYATYARDVDGEISCISCAPENVSAFSWLVKPKAYDVESTVSKPCQGILEWKSQRLTCAPHPLAGVINIEWSASPVFIARYKRDDDTILPGYIYVDNGVLHFVCAYMVAAENNQHRVIISTQNATKGLGHMGDAKDVSFEFLDREAADIELLVAEADQFPFNSAVSWAHPAELYQESRTTVVAHESVDGRVHLAWCLGESGVYLGTQVEDSEVATYFEPGPGGAGTLTMTTTFLVLTGLWRQWFLSNWSVPHPELEWRQPNRPNLNCSLIAHFATSAGVLTVSRSKSQSMLSSFVLF